MSFLKDINTSIKHAKDIQKGMKDLGFSFGKKGGDKGSDKSASQPQAASPTASTATPSTAPSTSTVAYTPASTPAATTTAQSVVQAVSLLVPVCKKEGVPAKIPLSRRKQIRDDFENKKPQLEEEYSKILGTPWKIHVDTAGVYSYADHADPKMGNPGNFMYQYFDSVLGYLRKFAEEYGAAGLASINGLAPQHLVTLEPTFDESVNSSSNDFFEGRLRILFRDTKFGSNMGLAGETLATVVNTANKSGDAAVNPANPSMSLKAQKDIRERYEAEVGEVLAKAKRYLANPDLVFVPNFEANYAVLAAFHVIDAAEDKDRLDLREDWESTMGGATLEYFKYFVTALDEQGFRRDDLMQEGFKEAVETNAVAFVVKDKLPVDYCDCVIEDGTLLIRCTPKSWWSGLHHACVKLSDLL